MSPMIHDSLAPSMTLLDVPAGDLTAASDAFGRLSRKEIFGVLVRGVFDAAMLERLSEELIAGRDTLPRSKLPEKYRLEFRGMGLDIAGPKLDGYLEAAATFRRELPNTPGASEVLSGIERVVSGLTGGRTLGVPACEGREYTPFTFRQILPGGCLPPHWENEHVPRPAYEHLRTLIDGNMISLLCPLAIPEAGGQVVAYDLRWPDDGRFAKPTAEELESRHGAPILPPPGDMVMFDSGRYYHEVTPVQGARARWTIGLFAALSRDGRSVYYWS